MGNEHDMALEIQSLKYKLMAIILLETSRSYKEMDGCLVSECVSFLMELEGKENLTKEEIAQRVSKIPFKGKIAAIGSYTKKKFRAKRLAVIAAVIAILFALFGIFAIASGDTHSELLRQMGEALFEMLDGGALEYEDITIYKTNETKTYASINELCEAEGISILYPAWLPDNEKIVKVWYVDNDLSKSYVFQCNNPLHSIEIAIGKELTESLKINCTEKMIAGHTIYYEDVGQNKQANIMHNNAVYMINSDTDENLFKIIENLEEIN